ncbi:uncharacterized protein LOC124404717 [Diprion similis]|uniref:uncharacterized protein LOC124404717 n=1 Tax=Diprion similis TaxID=362088 RepID=UPI001EF841D5|nr:uncharacterized protein LOC124404717 [Diprion similis]
MFSYCVLDWSSSAPNADPASEIQCLSDDYEFVENLIKANGCSVPVLPERVTKTIHSATIRIRAAENRVTEIRKMTPLQHISDSTPSTSSQEDTLLIEPEHLGSSNSEHNLHNGMHSVPKKRCQRKMAAVQRLEKSITQADQLAIISQKDQESRQIYYQRKLELYERDVIAKERIAHSLKELLKNYQ